MNVHIILYSTRRLSYLFQIICWWYDGNFFWYDVLYIWSPYLFWSWQSSGCTFLCFVMYIIALYDIVVYPFVVFLICRNFNNNNIYFSLSDPTTRSTLGMETNSVSTINVSRQMVYALYLIIIVLCSYFKYIQKADVQIKLGNLVVQIIALQIGTDYVL